MGFLSRLSNFFSSSKQNDNKTPSKLSTHSHPKLDSEVDNLTLNIDTTILIVDDSKTQVAACRKWLSDAGYKTISAGDGREGILKTKQEHPDLILMDIVMPNVNGYQATRYLKRHATTKHIPIVLISGEEQSSGRIWAKKLGACCFMVKPMDKEKLLHLTQRILEPK
ncbi:MAG: response regulator [Gammaproteobacteria bacterium]|nr:response regulator [Gammaproteobacteria bacterium]